LKDSNKKYSHHRCDLNRILANHHQASSMDWGKYFDPWIWTWITNVVCQK
jgi:hypothetical protein